MYNCSQCKRIIDVYIGRENYIYMLDLGGAICLECEQKLIKAGKIKRLKTYRELEDEKKEKENA